MSSVRMQGTTVVQQVLDSNSICYRFLSGYLAHKMLLIFHFFGRKTLAYNLENLQSIAAKAFVYVCLMLTLSASDWW